MKPRILIEVSGGNVQYIAANQDVDIAIVDWDNIQRMDEDDYRVNVYEPDLRIPEYGKFTDHLYTGDNGTEEQTVAKELKEIGW